MSKSSLRIYCTRSCLRTAKMRAAGKNVRWNAQRGSRPCKDCGETKPPAAFKYWKCTIARCIECEKKRNRPRTLAYYKAHPLEQQRRVCIVCAKGFVPGGNNQKFCSQKCHDERDRRTGRRSLGRLALPFERYAEMYAEQNGCCAVCREPQDKMAVDHCHETKKIRRLLCRNCNLALGFVKENAVVAQRLVEYIKSECAPLVASFLEDRELADVQQERLKVVA
mgnify:CR=1 FL=1